jgi:hypothetical protein
MVAVVASMALPASPFVRPVLAAIALINSDLFICLPGLTCMKHHFIARNPNLLDKGLANKTVYRCKFLISRRFEGLRLKHYLAAGASVTAGAASVGFALATLAALAGSVFLIASAALIGSTTFVASVFAGSAVLDTSAANAEVPNDNANAPANNAVNNLFI